MVQRCVAAALGRRLPCQSSLPAGRFWRKFGAKNDNGGYADGNHSSASWLRRGIARCELADVAASRRRLRKRCAPRLKNIRCWCFAAKTSAIRSRSASTPNFGPLETTKVGSLGTGTHLSILTTVGPDGNVVPPDHRNAMRDKANQLWHTDSSFESVPALASVLSARTIPALAAKPNSSRRGRVGSARSGIHATDSQIASRGTITPIRAARLRRV